MVPVVVVDVVVVIVDILFDNLNDLVAQSRSNNLGRSSKVRTILSK